MSEQQSRCPVIHFDHHSPEHAADTVGAYSKLRSESPVAWTESYGGYWSCPTTSPSSRHLAMTTCSPPPATTSTAARASRSPSRRHRPLPHPDRAGSAGLPPVPQGRQPGHRARGGEEARQRDQALRHRLHRRDHRVRRGRPGLRRRGGARRGDRALARAGCREVSDYVNAMHTLVSAAPGSAEYRHAAEVAVPWVSNTVREHIAKRRADPTDDATSHFIKTPPVDGRDMTDDEVYSILELVISGGVGTTASLVTQALVWLYQNPEDRQRLIDNPELVDVATEEFLRVFSPTQALARTIMQDADFQGCPVRKGDRACWPGPRPTGTRSSSRTPTPSTSPAGRTATCPSAWGGSIGAPAPTSARRCPRDAAPGARPDGRLRRGPGQGRDLPPRPGHQCRLPFDPGNLHPPGHAAQ